MIDFIELADQSRNNYIRTHCSENERNHKTLYVAISENNEVSCAYDSAVIVGAFQCILIHSVEELAVTNWYRWYKPEFINCRGLNLEGIIGNDCYIRINYQGSYSNQIMTLYHGDEEIYSCRPPFEGHMQGLWDAYCNTLNDSQNELEELRAQLSQREDYIHELEKKINRYKQIFTELKDILKP